ncbi:serine/threonine-protein kinase [Streptoverticillium reticulum]|uniref:serine/threonine-protein kinase n=1 Tax=Streptoverticillium reticulum TaxID=1433415 RepID=UPI0039BF29C9
MQPLLPEDPQVVGAYRLLGRLGAGGMGRVYLGRSAGGRTVAVKIVHPHFAADDQFRERFRREVRAARSVGGAWTAPVLDADPEAAVPWVATGYVAGPSLSEAVATAGPLPAAAVRALGAGLAEALTAVHGQGLVHRDVKPSNVLLALDGPRIVDFGIARATEATASLTSTGVSVGSPGYMAPEQILGRDVTGAADVFSLGAVLAYAATGAPPFPGDSSAALLYKVVHEPPVLGPALTGELRSLVADCLAKEAAARPSPQDLARRLAPADGGARALLRSGWLPGPVVEEVSRRAVELLDLEAEPAAGAGAFGPPDPSYGAGVAPAPEAVPAPRPARPRRVALSAVLGGRRSRRASCTLVLSVAGVLAAATTAAFVFDLLPGKGGGGGTTSAGRPATSAPPDRSPASSVPEAFLGTWSGDVVQSDGTANGTMTSTITAGGTGAYVVRTRYGALGVVECDSKAKLLSASASKITLEEVTDGELRFGCTGVTATVTYTLAPGGRLAFASGDPTGGRPTATLSRGRG